MKTTVAVGQMTSTANKSENLELCEHIIEQATLRGARLLSLPENFAFLGAGDDAALSAAESLEGISITRLKQSAKKNKIWLSLGGFQEKIPHEKRIYNSHLIINDEGDLVALYRKIHLFCAKLPDGSVYDEARSVLPGNELVCFTTPFFKLGLSICYDLRFPELFAGLRALGAEVMLIPAAFTEMTGKAHWEVLLRARAIETQSYMIAAAQIGRHNDKRSTYGHAMMVEPWGRVISQCETSDRMAVAEIDINQVRTLREQMPIWQHRRNLLAEPNQF